MTDKEFLKGKELDDAVTPFYRALGEALARWQHVESSLFILIHGILQTEYKLSSTIFFHIKSPSSKLQLADELCQAYFPQEVLDQEWKPLLKELVAAVSARNCLAHFEVNFITDLSALGAGEPPVALTVHHLNVRAATKESSRSVATAGLVLWGLDYLNVTKDVLRFAKRQFPVERLRAGNLPQRIGQLLGTFPVMPPGSLQPPRSSEA